MMSRRFASREARDEIIKTIKRCGFSLNDAFKFNIDMSFRIVRKAQQIRNSMCSFWMSKSNAQEITGLEGTHYIGSLKVVISTDLTLIAKNPMIYKADDSMKLSIYSTTNGVINELHTAQIPFQLCYNDVQIMHNDLYLYYDEGKAMSLGFFSRDNLNTCLTKPVDGFTFAKFVNRIENEIKWFTSTVKSDAAVADITYDQQMKHYSYDQYMMQPRAPPMIPPTGSAEYHVEQLYTMMPNVPTTLPPSYENTHGNTYSNHKTASYN